MSSRTMSLPFSQWPKPLADDLYSFFEILQNDFTWLDVSIWWHAVPPFPKKGTLIVPGKELISSWLRSIMNSNPDAYKVFFTILDKTADPECKLDADSKALALRVKEKLAWGQFASLFQ